MNEVRRVHGVLEGILRQSKSGWLVGDKVTAADIAFDIWTDIMENWSCMPANYSMETEFPHVFKWYKAIEALPGVASVQQEREKAQMRYKERKQGAVVNDL